MNEDEFWAIVPAAGIGSRMLADRPKQYLKLDGKTVLEQTLTRLASHPNIAGIVIAIAEHDTWWPELSINTECPIYDVIGGEHRADSVFSALTSLSKISQGDPWVLVHDAARPCLRLEDIDKMLVELRGHQVGGVLGIPVNDTVKRVNAKHEVEETVCRQGLWRASTPQMFRLHALTEALEQAKLQQYVVTDDASAMELAGFLPKMVAGHPDNIKITVPQDLALASLYLQQQREEQ